MNEICKSGKSGIGPQHIRSSCGERREGGDSSASENADLASKKGKLLAIGAVLGGVAVLIAILIFAAPINPLPPPTPPPTDWLSEALPGMKSPNEALRIACDNHAEGGRLAFLMQRALDNDDDPTAESYYNQALDKYDEALRIYNILAAHYPIAEYPMLEENIRQLSQEREDVIKSARTHWKRRGF
jgi:hypothetical protein